MNLKEQIGKKAGPYWENVPVERLVNFRQAVGARDIGEAPPTFLTVCRRGEFELFQQLNIPLSRVLHGEQEYVFTESVRPGDRLSYETTLVQAFEKRGSTAPMQFLVFETAVSRQEGLASSPVATTRTTIIVRGGI